MKVTEIPPWTPSGLLPPINPDHPTGSNRSPYVVSLVDIVLRFNMTAERRRILSGFLRFRSELHSLGLNSGFQWLDGSFLEDVETLEQRAPGDIDVVTFVETPENLGIDDRMKAIMDHYHVKREYSVDHYFVELGLPSRDLVAQSTYWSGVWSHRRSMQWKGFLQIVLDPFEDDVAKASLEERERQEAVE